jgi:hypothetical protein
MREKTPSARTSHLATAFALLGLVCMAGCPRCAQPPVWTFDANVGFVSSARGVSCLSIKADVRGQKPTLQVVDPIARRRYSASIVSARETCLQGPTRTDGLHSYTIQFDSEKPPTPLYAIGILGAKAEVHDANGTMTVDLDGDGRSEMFRACTSGEGVHLTVWTDAAVTGTRRWHAYQPLGYDVSPTCTPADYASP